MLRELIEKGDNMQRQMGNISREKEVLRKNQNGILGIKNKGSNKNEYLCLAHRLTSHDQRICELECGSTETAHKQKCKEKEAWTH